MSKAKRIVLGQIHSEARQEIGLADQKASILLATLGIGYGLVFGAVAVGDWHAPKAPGCDVFWWAFVIVAILATATAGAAIWPRKASRARSGDISYWGDVAEYADCSEFAATLAGKDFKKNWRLVDQTWQVSRILRRKYALVRVSIGFGATSLALGLVVFAL